MPREMSDAERLRDAYTDAFAVLAALVGHPELDLAPSVDPDQVPAGAITAGQNAVILLAAAVGLLVPDSAPADPELTAEDALAGWTRPGRGLLESDYIVVLGNLVAERIRARGADDARTQQTIAGALYLAVGGLALPTLPEHEAPAGEGSA